MVAFETSVVVIGFIGGIANLLMLLILAKSKARKIEMSIVFNQMILDFLCCVLLVLSYVVKMLDIDYGIVIGRALCKTLTGEVLVWHFLGCSTTNLVILTLERYVKIVHAVFHKKHCRQWMYFVAIGLTWVNFDLIFNATISFMSNDISGRQCLIFNQFPATLNVAAYAVYRCLVSFIVPLVVFVFCYSRILQVTHRRIIPVNFNNMMKSAVQQKTMKTQMNVIITFLIISILFVLCWSPTRISFFLYNLNFITVFTSDIRFVTVFIAFLNVCLNPFIYAAKLDPVKKYLRQILCNRRSTESDDNVRNVVNVISNPATRQTTT